MSFFKFLLNNKHHILNKRDTLNHLLTVSGINVSELILRQSQNQPKYLPSDEVLLRL